MRLRLQALARLCAAFGAGPAARLFVLFELFQSLGAVQVVTDVTAVTFAL